MPPLFLTSEVSCYPAQFQKTGLPSAFATRCLPLSELASRTQTAEPAACLLSLVMMQIPLSFSIPVERLPTLVFRSSPRTTSGSPCRSSSATVLHFSNAQVIPLRAGGRSFPEITTIPVHTASLTLSPISESTFDLAPRLVANTPVFPARINSGTFHRNQIPPR